MPTILPDMVIDRNPAALAPLPPGYHDLFARVLGVVERDERIRGLWLSGSLGRGAADAGSDLDLAIAVRDEEHPAFAKNWRTWLAGISDVLIARPLGDGGSFHSLTTDLLRLDVWCEPASKLATSPHRRRAVVLDRDELSAVIPEPDPLPGPDKERIARLVEEFFRQWAIFPWAVVARPDWLLGVEGVHAAAAILYDIFVEANQPLPPMGVKQWSAKLTAEQRAVLTELPRPQPNRESVIAAMAATADAIRTAGRAAVENAGVTWPLTLEAAVVSGSV